MQPARCGLPTGTLAEMFPDSNENGGYMSLEVRLIIFVLYVMGAYLLLAIIRQLKNIRQAVQKSEKHLRRQQIVSSQCDLGDEIYKQVQHGTTLYLRRERKMMESDGSVTYSIYATDLSANPASTANIAINLEREFRNALVETKFGHNLVPISGRDPVAIAREFLCIIQDGPAAKCRI
jgi:hypothetical protein